MFIEVVEPQLPSPQSIAQLMQKSIAEANEGITHAEFAAGAQGGTIGFKCMVGAPQQFITSRVLKAIFGIFVLLYSLAPLILVPIWAYHERNAWLLVGIPVSYIASYSAAVNSKLVFLFLMLCVGVWLWNGFSFHQYITFFFFCSLWGYLFYQFAGTNHRMCANDRRCRSLRHAHRTNCEHVLAIKEERI
jgi:hypothetical protein